MFSFAFLSLFCCSCELTLVLKSCIYCKYVLRPSLRLGNFGPDRSLFGKVVEVVRFIHSHKILKGPQFELCPPRILPVAGAEGQHQPWERTEARMGVRLLGRAMLGQTVVAAIIYGFVG